MFSPVFAGEALTLQNPQAHAFVDNSSATKS
jgi:hypothetical protein